MELPTLVHYILGILGNDLKQKGSVRVNFSGTSEASAELLRSLVAAGIPLTEFHCTTEDLETIFLKLGHQQVS